MFKDFYISGELRREGHFQTIDTLDDRRTAFDGDVVSYFRNGRISGKSYYSSGLLEGEYRQYDENGTLKTRASYAGGELSGTYEIYNEDSSCRIVEYRAGLPVHDYYLLADGSGNTLKFRIADDMPVWESPAMAERSVDYRDGVLWEVYFKNGLTIALTDAIVRDYGKWHRVDVIISNNSLTPVEFNPETDMTAYSVNEHDVATDLQVWSCDSYLKKVNRSQTWAAVLMGVSEGMASAGAGYSTSTMTGYSSYGGYSSYTTTTDDRLGEFGVMARHVDVRVSENFGQHVDRHPVLDGHTGEGVAGTIGGRHLVDAAHGRDFLQTAVWQMLLIDSK